jgi:hypothetical protein
MSFSTLRQRKGPVLDIRLVERAMSSLDARRSPDQEVAMPKTQVSNAFVPSMTDEESASELHARIKAKHRADWEDRTLISFTMRMPIRTHKMLDEAARLHSISMTQIILFAIEPVLPRFLKKQSAFDWDETK